MGKVINFEDRAVASLQARVAAAEEANQELIAFARGPSGAVASIHEALLAPLHRPVADRLSDHPARETVLRWQHHLARDRRRSPHTVRAYVATAHRLIDFLAGHLGGPVDEAALAALRPADLRAFLTRRRAE